MTWPCITCHTATHSLRATATAALLRPRRRAMARPHFCSGLFDLEEFLGRLDQQRADRAAAMAFERGGSFPLSALAHAGVESEVRDELSAVGKAGDIANGRDQSI